MKKGLLALLILPLAFDVASATEPTSESVATTMRRAADWQLANPTGTSIRDWIIAPLYDGFLRTSITLDEPKYLAEVVRLGNQAMWGPGRRVYFADDHAVGHAWLDIYLIDPSKPERLEPIKERMDFVIANPITERLSHLKEPQTPDVRTLDRWTWCDALYMAPPTLSRLYAATGDDKYLQFLDQEFRVTYDDLWDADEDLFYRDARFIGQETPNGKKIFWSRGNGWVYGGIALVLENLPRDHPTREFYEDVFRRMTTAVVASQQEDGLWRPSLLDPEMIPEGETSGSGFFTFGLAWGINNGVLDADTFRDAALLGWAGLETRIHEDGTVGYVQPVGAAPDQFNRESTHDYGTGAFLLAGSEIYRMLGGPSGRTPAEILAAAEVPLEEATPQAFARLVPERKDDLAWENDKVAFRIYGPALLDSTEDAGIDIWCKRVPDLVINKWYALDLAGKQSYHTDHGEGYDGYKVGDSLGCGGLGLWDGEKIVTANVYRRGGVGWSTPDVAEFEVGYLYEDFRGQRIYERRMIRLHVGEYLFESTSTFFDGSRGSGSFRNRRNLSDLPVAIGLVTQSTEGEFSLDPENGIVMLWDQLDGESLGSGIVVAPETVEDMKVLGHTGAPKNREHGIVIVNTNEEGQLHYRAGFGWGPAGEITTPEAWRAVLDAAAASK